MRRVRVGLDGRALGNVNRHRGIGRYTACLVEGLAEGGGDYRFLLFGYGREPEPGLLAPGTLAGLEWREIPRSGNLPYLSLLGDHLLFARAVRDAGVDLFHAMDHNMSPFLDCPSLVTVHDLIPLVLGGPYLGPTSRLWMRAHRRAARKADVVVAVSENTRRDVERLWGIPAERIAVVPEGVSAIYRPVGDRGAVEETAARYGVSRPYFLYLGGFDPRKNIRNMLLSFKRFLLAGGGRYQMALCGDAGVFRRYLHDEIEELGLEGKVVLCGFVEEESLPALYSGAVAFLCLSLYEGFGLPLLEAMACGCPVIASRAASIPEVAGDAAVLVDPLDPADIVAAMERLVGEPESRQRCVEKGLRRSSLFRWDKTVGLIHMLYEKALKGGGRD